MTIDASNMNFEDLNKIVKSTTEDICINKCLGQRYIGSGAKARKITINGTPGNALGAYLDGATIEVNGNAQDAVGNTMNDGKIIIHGSAGDALGYSMRGGTIYVKGSAGYRAGVHMKEYQNKKPVIVIGGGAGSFLGEYLAGGLIIVLGLGSDSTPVGDFTGTGMHGGRIFIRGATKELPQFPAQATADIASHNDLITIKPHITEFANYFSLDAEALMSDKFIMLTPNTKNPYNQLYTKHYR